MARRFFLLIVVCTGSFLAGCVSSPQPERAPGYLVVGLENSPTTLDPRYATDANSSRIGALIFNSLTRTDQDGNLRPELAERWEIIDDRTYLFHLRKGITFHNGKPFTAADVEYTYRSIRDPKNHSPVGSALQFLKSVEQIAPYQVRFRLAAPYAPFLENTNLGIVPEGISVGGGSRSEGLMGTGPFALERILPGERIVLKANANYWEGPPSISGLIFKIIPDAMIRALEFKKGGVDFLQNDLEPDMLPWLEKKARATVKIAQGTTFQYMGMNLEHPVLRRREVREAIACGIDRELLIRHLLKGLATSATGLLSPLNWAYEPTVTKFAYDPQKAKRLLDQAGFTDPDGDGPMPRFKLSYKTTNLDLRRRMAEALKEQLSQIGIDLEVRTYEWGTFYADIKQGNFHLYTLQWVGADDPDIYFNLFHSRSIPPNGDNRGRYQNPDIDHLLEMGRRSLNQEERKLIYGKVQKILAQDLPYVPLWWMKNVVLTRPEIQGFIPYPDGDLISLKGVTFSSLKPPA
jgi:peptide/nickel transport system substrate-binding protein